LHWAAIHAKKDILASASLSSQSSFTVLAVIVIDPTMQLMKNTDNIQIFPDHQQNSRLSLTKSIT